MYFKPAFSYDEKVLDRVIKNWMEFKEMSLIPRAGYAKYGIYPEPDYLDNARWESDLEHTAGLWKLVKLIQQNFPGEIFQYWEIQDGLEIADIHEVGEKVTGDVCDDGQRDAEELDKIEQDFVREVYLVGYSRKSAAHLFNRFVEFQKRSTHFGRLMYCCDKCEAILQGLLYEKQGRGGKMYYADSSPLEIEGARVTNSYKLVDVWAYSFVKNAKDYEHFGFFVELITKAAQIVRNEDDPFPWIRLIVEK